MNDRNGREIQTGDIVKVEGGYFKTSNGIFYVSNLDTERSLWLHRVKKNGEICVNSASSTQSWPLSSYCSDPRKNAEARKHNAEHVTIEVVENVNTWYVAEHFRQKAAERRAGAENARRVGGDPERCEQEAAQYDAVADRLAAKAQPVKAKEPERGVKFYWNGIKVDGGRLIPCGYWLNDDGSVGMYAKDYKNLPREYFAVKNNSDPYTDYHDDDSTTLTPEHPLYRFARYNALKGIMNGRSYKVPTPEQKAEWERTSDPGQPTAADMQAVEDMKLAAESARLAREKAEQLEQREANLRKISEGRHYIESVAAEHPIQEGQPTVSIGFSESPYLYSLSHGLNNVFSVAAAEIILKHYDELHHAENRGYEKTDFTVYYTDPESGELDSYEGRYDLGDNDGGLIEHIRKLNGWYRTHDRFTGKEIENPSPELTDGEKLADYLEQFTEGGRVVKVEFSPKIVEFAQMKKAQQAKEVEQARKDFAETMSMVEMLTDEQLKSAVLLLDPAKSDELDIARFFLQQLAQRDRTAAVELFNEWREGKAGAGE